MSRWSAGGRTARAVAMPRQKDARARLRTGFDVVKPDTDGEEEQSGGRGKKPVADLAIRLAGDMVILAGMKRQGGARRHEEHAEGKQDSQGTVSHRPIV